MQSIFISSLPRWLRTLFQTITVTVYHDSVPSGRGTFSLQLTIAAFAANGNPYYPIYTPAMKILNSGSTVDSVSINFGTTLLKNERLWVIITIGGGLDQLKMYWGDSAHPSQVSYDGTASYVPEFLQTSLCLSLIATALFLVIVYRKNHTNNSSGKVDH